MNAAFSYMIFLEIIIKILLIKYYILEALIYVIFPSLKYSSQHSKMHKFLC